jgi:diguanylate cyclase (GGDEF)-like protein
MIRPQSFTVAAGLAALTAGAGWLVAARRLHARAAQLEHAERHATVDGLTGLWRREGFEQHAPAALAHGNLAGLLDLDGFKQINDTYGHPVGDDVLRAIAGRLVDELGETALVARLGGDEFALIATLPFPDAPAQLDHLVGALATPIRTSAGTLEVGVSLGVVWLPHLPSWNPTTDRGTTTQAAELLTEALSHADIAMYEAKRQRLGWRLYHPVRDPSRPAARMCPAPPRRYREHGPAALATSQASGAANREGRDSGPVARS